MRRGIAAMTRGSAATGRGIAAIRRGTAVIRRGTAAMRRGTAPRPVCPRGDDARHCNEASRHCRDPSRQRERVPHLFQRPLTSRLDGPKLRPQSQKIVRSSALAAVGGTDVLNKHTNSPYRCGS